MHSSRLPLELYRTVIDHLHDDEASLRACSLTCRAFLPESRYHLFHHVYIDQDTAERFLDIICPNSPTNPIAFIRQLCMYEARGYFKFERPWMSDALPLLTTRLPDITKLELDCLDWSLLDDTARTTILSGFQKVTHLRMLLGAFKAYEDTNRFISSFPSLTKFVCSHTKFTSKRYMGMNDPLTTPLIPLPRSLTSITVEEPRQAIFFHRLLCLETHPDVRKLDISINNIKKSGMLVGMLLKTIGASLEHLSIGIHYGYEEGYSQLPFSQNVLTLAHNTNLRSINFDCGTIYQNQNQNNNNNNNPYASSHRWVFALLDQIILSWHLKSIMLRFRLTSVDDLDTVDWARIQELFTTREQQWPNLRKLKISLYLPIDEVWPAVSKSIKARLPVLDGCGFLHIWRRGTVC